MPPKRFIRDFFKPFTIPEHRIPIQTIEDEIIVVSTRPDISTRNVDSLSAPPELGPPTNVEPPQKRGRGRPRKDVGNAPVDLHAETVQKRGRGRPRKNVDSASVNLHEGAETLQKRGRGRPRKDVSDGHVDLREVTRTVLEATGSATPTTTSPTEHDMHQTDVSEESPRETMSPTTSDSGESSPIKPRPTTVTIMSPSPQRTSINAPPDPARQWQPPQQQPAKTADTSFSSLTSFRSSQSSSRRIVRNGAYAVTNSDSASMSSGGSGSSSEDDLVEISAFLPRKKVRLTPPPQYPSTSMDTANAAKAGRSSTRISDRDSQLRRAKLRVLPPAPAPVKYKHSLAALVKSQAKLEQTEARIREAEEQVEKTQRQHEEAAKVNAVLARDEERTIAARLMEDEDDGGRMLQAMERTEALKTVKRYSFFSQKALISEKVPEFPKADLNRLRLSFLLDKDTRNQACLSGFLADIAARQGLPHSVAQWLMDRIPHEPSEALRESYVGILQAVMPCYMHQSHRGGWGEDYLRPKRITQLYHDQINEDETNPMACALPESLPCVLRAIRATVDMLTTKIPIVAELIRLNIDSTVQETPSVQQLLQQALEELTDTSEYRCRPYITYTLTTNDLLKDNHPTKQQLCQIASCLSAASPHLHGLRRHLALYLVLGEHVDPKDPTTTDLIIKAIQTNPDFHINDNTDYDLLLSLIETLDIAIDVGFSDFAFPLPPSRSASPPPEPKALTVKPKPVLDAAVRAFDVSIDALTASLRAMASKIRDAGTSHLKRTEAKSAIDRLVVRLEGTVRLKEKPRKGIFGGVDGRGAAQKGLMDRFVTRSGEGVDVIAETGLDGE